MGNNSTIFDDVFRTMLERMPSLIIPVINEVFHTSYSEDEKIEQYAMNTIPCQGKWLQIPIWESVISFIMWNVRVRRTVE